MIRIAIAEDHRLFREGISSLLSDIRDFRVVASYANGKEYVNGLAVLEAEIVLMDIEMPVMNGIEATRISREQRPGIQVIALSMYSEQQYYFEMIQSGIAGFLLKEASPAELEKAIREVYGGMGFFSPQLLQQAVRYVPGEEKKRKMIEGLRLTAREMEILDLICQGLNNNGIAEKLFVSPRTVETHKSNLLMKTQTRNTAELIIFAIRNGLKVI